MKIYFPSLSPLTNARFPEEIRILCPASQFKNLSNIVHSTSVFFGLLSGELRETRTNVNRLEREVQNARAVRGVRSRRLIHPPSRSRCTAGGCKQYKIQDVHISIYLEHRDDQQHPLKGFTGRHVSRHMWNTMWQDWRVIREWSQIRAR